MKNNIARSMVASLLACSLAGTSALAQPLAPGRPAGVNAAQLDRETVAVVAGGLALVAGFAVLISSQKLNNADVIFSVGNNAVGGISTTNTASSTGSQ